MLELRAISRRARRKIDKPLPVAPAYDREAERVASGEILAQAQWLYEQHERRVQNCQNMAVAILTIVGTIMALAPSLIPDSPNVWEVAALLAVTGAGVVTIVQCVRVLIPHTRANGLPGVDALRDLAHRHEHLSAAAITIPVTQFATDLLNPLKLTDPSPLTQASKDAARRTDILAWAFGWFATTFALAAIMATSFALVS